MGKQIIKLAFIGTGGWARRHHFPALAHIQQQEDEPYELQLRGVTSLESEIAQMIAAQYHFQHVYPNLDALLMDNEVTAIAVAVPPEVAYEVLLSVNQLNIPIISEKPPGINVNQAEDLSKKIKVPNLVTFNRRFSPLNLKFRQLVEQMVDITFVQGRFYRHNRLDETFMIGTGIHWINFIEYTIGTIQHVTPYRWLNPENNSWLRTGHLIFANNIKGYVQFFPCSGSEFERLEVHSNQKSIYLDGPMPGNPGSITIDTAGKQERVDQPTPLPSNIIRIGIVGEYQAFFRLITNGTPAPSTFQNAVNSMRVAEALEYGYSF